ncbi:hypothetical protein M902_3256 [Bacteriovorax sp. BAL6_X]|uniref:group III truncated hemoglobin n=1 Tax=Bacteriovorax sp. BAL6_X TaxID=1201290 RepID=UPI00038662F8|nr:group III truncated hemoglobin [Bacteriovorax sp. BAL6_X]EPZ50704.1 hypothetical protein M902_3256 [Bacteriovorax sp. BAL6_X]
MTGNDYEINIIEKVTRTFYTKAINDVFIGYHFRKITAKNVPLANIDDFNEHLEVINAFWQSQLLGIKFPRPAAHLLEAHEYLNIRLGELGRWVILFKETLEEYREENPEFINAWEVKIDAFQTGFKKYFFKK